jgi:exonuclease-1
MGIPNLLRFLKPFIEPVHINKYAGKRVKTDPISAFNLQFFLAFSILVDFLSLCGCICRSA